MSYRRFFIFFAIFIMLFSVTGAGIFSNNTADAKDFKGVIGKSIRESKPSWSQPVKAPKGSPNILLIFLDDFGFTDIGSFGSEIKTPNIDSLAKSGLRYNNFTNNAVCSPSRSSLLTGLNSHSTGVGWVTNVNLGFPGYVGEMTLNSVTIAEMLKDNGYSTMMTGKWHLTAGEHQSYAGPYDSWPTHRGFERYWGFFDGLTCQWIPHSLINGTEVIATPTDGSFYLPDAMADKTIEMLKEQKATSPDKPFFMYYATGAVHWPHHTKKEDREKYIGKYDKGWDKIREERLSRLKKMGIAPENTKLSPHNPGVKPWDKLTPDEKKMAARFQENYAAFVDNTDQNIGHLLSYLEKVGELKNTLVILASDNGASGETTYDGAYNAYRFINGIPTNAEVNLKFYDKIGGPETRPHYNHGWLQASNTPFKYSKRTTHGGGVRSPLIISWPGKIKDKNSIRNQFHHVTDIMPTILEIAGIKAPDKYKGRDVKPIAGKSMLYSFNNKKAKSKRTEQYYEIEGHRAYVDGDWKIVTYRGNKKYDEIPWELYNLKKDFSETNNLSEKYPEKVKKLEKKWWKAAKENNVLPIDDRPLYIKAFPRNPSVISKMKYFTYYPGMSTIERSKTPPFRNRSYSISAKINRKSSNEEGVLAAQGDMNSGYTFYIKDNLLVYEHNVAGEGLITKIVSDSKVPIGDVDIRFDFTKTKPFQGKGELFINGKKSGEADFAITIRFPPWEGLDIGCDLRSPVSKAYKSPFAFSGKLENIIYNIK
ncbi:MAG: arylsulfatase [Desulfobacteraceae bacterium]|nr:arylsulfatase [Desulfobacteraceae bacterium]